jgi:hypothetical protein
MTMRKGDAITIGRASSNVSADLSLPAADSTAAIFQSSDGTKKAGRSGRSHARPLDYGRP